MKKTLTTLALAAAMLIAAPPLAKLTHDAGFFGPSEAYAVTRKKCKTGWRCAKREARQVAHLGIAAPRFVRGRLVCAINTGRFLVMHGFRSTGSASSKSYLKFRRVPKSQAGLGTVRYNSRKGGGHVQPVIGWRDGKLMCANPSSRRQAWVVKQCPAGGVYLKVPR